MLHNFYILQSLYLCIFFSLDKNAPATEVHNFILKANFTEQ